MPRHPGTGSQDAQAHSRHPFRQTRGRGYSSISGGPNGKTARLHGRHRQNPWRRRRPHRQLGRLGSFPVKLLLDTHIWLWSTLEPQRITRRVQKALADPANELWLSPVSVGELIVLLRKNVLCCQTTPQHGSSRLCMTWNSAKRSSRLRWRWLYRR